MTLRRVLSYASVLALGLNPACTFYTACPTNQDPGPGPGGGSGGNNGIGGSGTGATGADIGFGGEAPMGEWINETLNLVDLESECGNVSFLSSKPSEDLLIVSIAQHGLLARASDGSEWLPLGQGAGSATIINRGSTILYDPEDPNVFWESGIYNAGGVYRTDDGGDTFVDLGLTHNDYVSVDLTDPARQTLLASGHEMPQLLHYSTDGGESWEDIGANIPEDGHICSWPVVLDASTFLLGCGTYGGGTGNIFRSVDAGDSWEHVADHKIFPGPLLASDGAIYFSGEATEGVLRSIDQGQSWEGPFGKGELVGATPVELPDGRIAALGQGRILVSSDQGEHWQVVTTRLPYQPQATGIAYSTAAKAFYVWYWDCDSSVPDDAVMSYAFDYEQE